MRRFSSNFAFWPDCFARIRPGTAITSTSAMIATTIITSSKVMADCFFRIVTGHIKRRSCPRWVFFGEAGLMHKDYEALRRLDTHTDADGRCAPVLDVSP